MLGNRLIAIPLVTMAAGLLAAAVGDTTRSAGGAISPK